MYSLGRITCNSLQRGKSKGRALSSPTICRLFRKHYSCSPSGVSGAAMIWTWMPRRRRHRR